MQITITGCNGRVGKRVVALALERGHTVVGIDIGGEPSAESSNSPRFELIRTDLRDFDVVLKVLKGSEAVIHLAGYPNPGDYRVNTHNSNVVISWNVLQACAELTITRVAQASTVNVITMVYSQDPHFEYFPIDELHPCLPDEPYGLSKVICELQADTIVRRNTSMRIASLRLHWSVPSRSLAMHPDSKKAKNDLWGYVQEDSAADAFLRSVMEENGKWSGHEAFFIAAPTTSIEEETMVVKQRHWPNVPIKKGKDLSGKKGFFNCTKAKELLGWIHSDDKIECAD